MKIISGILVLITVFFSVRHGWPAVTMNLKPDEAKLFEELGINRPLGLVIGIVTLAVGFLILFPQTFFIANLLNATSILLIMALALRTGNLRMALIEIPFLLMPLLLIWLGYPLKK